MTEDSKKRIKYRCVSCSKYYYCNNYGDCNTSYCSSCDANMTYSEKDNKDLIGYITHGQGELIIGDLARPKSGVIYLRNTVCYNGCRVKFSDAGDVIYEQCDPDYQNPLATVRNRLWRFSECNNCGSYYTDNNDRGNLQGVHVDWCLIRGGSCEPNSYDTNLSFNEIYKCCALKFFRRYCGGRKPEWCLEKIDGKNEYYIVSRPYYTHKKYYMMIDLKYNLPVVLPVWYDNKLRYKRLKFVAVDKSEIKPPENDDGCNGCHRPNNVVENY